MKRISVYVINLNKRTDRRESIVNEFRDKPEFSLNIVEAIEHPIGALGLWLTIKHIFNNLVPIESPYITICEDDHHFTEDYNFKLWLDAINEAEQKEADLLLGGVSWFNVALQISPNLFWVDIFSGLQFSVVYRKFFKTIIDTDFAIGNAADYKISAITPNKMVVFPFMSTQKEFGYSDVTQQNNTGGYVTEIFEATSEKLEQIKSVGLYYNLATSK